MSPNATILMCVIALALSITLAFKFKTMNIGILAFFFAMLIGYVIGGRSINSLLAAWPGKVLFTLIVVPLFFSYAAQNGTVGVMADNLMYMFRHASWAMPIALWLVAYVLSALGAGSYATVILLGPLAFAVAAEAGLSPLIGIGVLVAANAGGAFYWTGGCAITASFMETAGVASDVALETAIGSSWATQPLAIGVCVVVYVLLRGWKAKPIALREPVKPNRKQKLNMIIIFCVVGISLLSMILGTLVQSPVTKWMYSRLDVRVLCLAASILCGILDLGDVKKVVASVPWNTVFMVSGVAILMSIALDAGLSDLLAGWISENIPLWLVPAILLFIAGLMSLFSSALSVVCPTLIPIAVALCAANPSLNCVECITAIMAGSSVTGCSPFSTGGSLYLSTCPDPKLAEEMVPKQFVWTFIILGVEIVLCLLGVLKIFGRGIQFVL